MTEHEDFFKCGDCTFRNRKDIYRCTADPDNNPCDMLNLKKASRLPIEKMLHGKMWAEEPITLSLKEMVVLREVIYLDLAKEEQQEMRKKSGSSIEEDL